MRVGVIGGAGYTAGELLRLLVNHPAAEIAFVHSDSNAGNALGDVHGGLLGETNLRFTAEYDLGAIDVLFLCSAHGQSRVWMENYHQQQTIKFIHGSLIDLVLLLRSQTMPVMSALSVIMMMVPDVIS